MDNRNTQFRGFAKLLYDELYDMFSNLMIEESNGAPGEKEADQTRKNILETIAERAYDLAFHAIDNSRQNCMEDWYTEQIIPFVPDMIELPKEQDE